MQCPHGDVQSMPVHLSTLAHSGANSGKNAESAEKQSTFITENIRGLITRKHKDKVQHIREMAINENAVIVALTESHLRESIRDAEVKMPHFQHYRADRSNGRKQGGVIVYVRDEFSTDCRVMSSGSTGTVEHIILHFRQSNLLVCCGIGLQIHRPATSRGQ